MLPIPPKQPSRGAQDFSMPILDDEELAPSMPILFDDEDEGEAQVASTSYAPIATGPPRRRIKKDNFSVLSNREVSPGGTERCIRRKGAVMKVKRSKSRLPVEFLAEEVLSPKPSKQPKRGLAKAGSQIQLGPSTSGSSREKERQAEQCQVTAAGIGSIDLGSAVQHQHQFSQFQGQMGPNVGQPALFGRETGTHQNGQDMFQQVNPVRVSFNPQQLGPQPQRETNELSSLMDDLFLAHNLYQEGDGKAGPTGGGENGSGNSGHGIQQVQAAGEEGLPMVYATQPGSPSLFLGMEFEVDFSNAGDQGTGQTAQQGTVNYEQPSGADAPPTNWWM